MKWMGLVAMTLGGWGGKAGALSLALVGLFLAACAGSVPATVPSPVPSAPTRAVPPTRTRASLLTPEQSTPAPAESSEPTSPTAPVTVPTATQAPAAACTGVELGGDWTQYLGTYGVRGAALGAGMVAWATDGGVMVWDPPGEPPVQYTSADGLGSNFTNDVAIAPDGSIWAATVGGVSHLAGGTWTNYKTSDGLVDNAVQAIAVTSDGVVWAGTVDGISRFAGGTWTTFQPGTRAWAIDLAPDGSLWFAGDAAGLIHYDPVGDTWKTYTPEGSTPAGVKTVGVDPDGNPWVYLGYDRVYRVNVNPGGDTATWEPVYDGREWVCAIDFSADGTPWLATCDGYRIYGAGLITRETPGGEWRHLSVKEGFPSRNVSGVTAANGDAAGGFPFEVAAATDRGLAVRGTDGLWGETVSCGPLSNRVTAVSATTWDGDDPESFVWFGFGGDSQPLPQGGVSRFTPGTGNWSRTLDEANVRVLAAAPDGSLWAGDGCQLYRLDRSLGDEDLVRDPSTFLVGACDVLQGNVMDLAFEPGGGVWVATGLGLAYFDGTSWQTYDRLVGSVAVTPASPGNPGMEVWVSGWEGTQDSYYVARFDGSTWTQVLDRSLASLAATQDGNLWGLAGERGVGRFVEGSWTFTDAADGRTLAGASALAIAPAAPGGTGSTIWVAASGTLFRFQGESWTGYDLPATLGDLAVEDMSISVDGTVWLATSRGVLYFDPAAEHAGAD